MIKPTLDGDIKTALLSKDSLTVTVLRSLKSAILYAEVAAKKRDDGLNDEEIILVMQKEAKKRQESAEAYKKGDRAELAAQELAEKAIIDKYLPKQMDDAEVNAVIDQVMVGFDAPTMQQMGQIIGAVKQKVGASADGSLVARLVKERLGK